jgi:hypothetical protein
VAALNSIALVPASKQEQITSKQEQITYQEIEVDGILLDHDMADPAR